MTEGGRPAMTNPILSFAKIDHRSGQGRVFGIRERDLLRHVYVLGKTGTGKSALLERLLLKVIHGGGGCALIDPHGDLAEKILEFVPRHRVNDVVLFDPADTEHPVGMNLLENTSPERRPIVASGALGVFRKIYSEYWGPRMEHVFRNVLLALLDVRGTTLLGVPRMLVEDRYRATVVRQVKDPLVRFFWTREFPTYPKPFLAEVIAPVENKVMALLASPTLRHIVGQHTSTIIPRDIMDEGRIVVANLSKGKLSEDASMLLGAALVTKFELAAYSRAELPERDRKPFIFILDEFASFVTDSFQSILSEGRKYGLSLVLAHQHLGQLGEELRRAVIGNAGTLITFRLGAEDAEILGPEYLPELAPHDLTRLARHQIAIRLMVDGLMTTPFTAVTLPPARDEEREGHSDLIRRVSRERYGVPLVRVKEMIERQMN